jgi:hypothetical protein
VCFTGRLWDGFLQKEKVNKEKATRYRKWDGMQKERVMGVPS